MNASEGIGDDGLGGKGRYYKSRRNICTIGVKKNIIRGEIRHESEPGSATMAKEHSKKGKGSRGSESTMKNNQSEDNTHKWVLTRRSH